MIWEKVPMLYNGWLVIFLDKEGTIFFNVGTMVVEWECSFMDGTDLQLVKYGSPVTLDKGVMQLLGWLERWLSDGSTMLFNALITEDNLESLFMLGMRWQRRWKLFGSLQMWDTAPVR